MFNEQQQQIFTQLGHTKAAFQFCKLNFRQLIATAPEFSEKKGQDK